MDQNTEFCVRSERQGNVTTVVIDRPARRNAGDGHGRAMDMILTGRGVAAGEALAADIAAFPQYCPCADRASAIAQWSQGLRPALQSEGASAAEVLAREGRAGARRFVGGAGRHGRFAAQDDDAGNR